MASRTFSIDHNTSLSGNVNAVSPCTGIQYKKCLKNGKMVQFSGRLSFSEAISGEDLLATGLPVPYGLANDKLDFFASILGSQKTVRLRIDSSGNLYNGWTALAASDNVLINVVYLSE